MKKLFRYFTKIEIIIWTASVVLIIVSYLAFSRDNCLSMIASVIGATSLMLNAKGNPIGQFLIIVFSVLYGIISYGYAYYGEMITYLGMSAPMAFFAMISWLRNPFKGKHTEVTVNKIKKPEVLFLILLTAAVTVAFYFILKHFNTSNLLPSTLSVTTTFVAAYLTVRRSAFFPIAYASNDVILIILWAMASYENIEYIPVIVCFVIFLVNDTYGFINWLKIEKRQSANN